MSSGGGGGFNGNDIANQLLIDHKLDDEINTALQAVSAGAPQQQATATTTMSRNWKDEVNDDNTTTTPVPVPVPVPARRSSTPATLATTTTTTSSSSTNSTYTHINNVNGDKTTYAITIENEKKHAADYSELMATTAGDTAATTGTTKKDKKKKKKKKKETTTKTSTSMVPMTKELYDQQQLLEQMRIKEQRIHNKFANQEAKDSFAYKKAIKKSVAQFKQNEIWNHSSNKKLRCVKGGV